LQYGYQFGKQVLKRQTGAVCGCMDAGQSLLSCLVFCVVCFFVSMLARWLAGKTYSRDIFRVLGFMLQRPDWRVIYCNDLLYVFL